MRFWDTSALLALIARDARTERASQWYREDSTIAVWWGTPTECVSALARREREGELNPEQMRQALARLHDASLAWVEVAATNDVRDHAQRLLRTHALRAADALQIAAAIVAASGSTRSLVFVTADARQALAAEREGFEVLM